MFIANVDVVIFCNNLYKTQLFFIFHVIIFKMFISMQYICMCSYNSVKTKLKIEIKFCFYGSRWPYEHFFKDVGYSKLNLSGSSTVVPLRHKIWLLRCSWKVYHCNPSKYSNSIYDTLLSILFVHISLIH